MFKQHYDCLIAGLPDLVIREYPKRLTSLKFRIELEEILKQSDFALLELMFRENDHRNLLNMLLHNDFQFDSLGNYKENYLISQLAEPTDIAGYMKILINEFKSDVFGKASLPAETRLYELFYSDVLKNNNEFVHQWFGFEQNLRNVLTVFNCSNYDYPLEKHLIPDKNNEDLNDLLLRENLSPDLFADYDLPWLEQIVRIMDSGTDFSEKEKAIDQIKWTFLDELTTFHYFTIEKILSFVLKLKMLDRWRELDDNTGKAFLKRLISDLEMSYSFA